MVDSVSQILGCAQAMWFGDRLGSSLGAMTSASNFFLFPQMKNILKG